MRSSRCVEYFRERLSYDKTTLVPFSMVFSVDCRDGLSEEDVSRVSSSKNDCCLSIDESCVRIL